MAASRMALVSFASSAFEGYRQALVQSAHQAGITTALSYGPSDLAGTFFTQLDPCITQATIGAGMWAWKPCIILDALNQLEEGATLIYSDADSLFHADAAPLSEMAVASGGMLFFKTMGYTNRAWTRRATFRLMGCDSPEYWEADILWAGFMVLRKEQSTVALMKEWMACCSDKRILTGVVEGLDASGGMEQPELPGFMDHRYDQSVLSLLAAKYGLPSVADLYHQFIRPDQRWEAH